MVMAGNEFSIEDLVTNLIYLEHDAIAAYDRCIERLDDKTLGTRIADFKRDHDDHLRVPSEMSRQLDIEAPTGGDIKPRLTTKIVLGDMIGDAAILKSMKTNDDDTVAAYERRAVRTRFWNPTHSS